MYFSRSFLLLKTNLSSKNEPSVFLKKQRQLAGARFFSIFSEKNTIKVQRAISKFRQI
jgi:hypothetical protein